MTQVSPARLVTITEAGRQLGVGKAKVYELINSGELPSVTIPAPGGDRVPRRVGEPGPKPGRRIDQADIDAFIKRHKRSA